MNQVNFETIPKKGSVLTEKVMDLAFGGKGIVSLDGYKVFVDGGLPGQEVEFRLLKKKKNFGEGKIIKVLSKSPDEIAIPYTPTPGAPWAFLPLELQQEYKKKQVFRLFKDLGKIDLELIFDQFVSSPESWEYRNKMEWSYGPTEETQDADGAWTHSGFGLGSKRRGQYWLVDKLEKPSGLFDAEFEKIVSQFGDFCENTGEIVYNCRSNKGFFRQVTVKKSFKENAFLVNIVTNIAENEDQWKKLFLEFWDNQSTTIAGLQWTQSEDLGNPFGKYKSRTLLGGADKFEENLGDLNFEISMDSFFQPNPRAAELLYEQVMTYLEPEEEGRYLDLFCGTGTIAQYIANTVKTAHITGVDIIPAAISNAQKNAANNGLENVKFVAQDAEKFLVQNPKMKPAGVVVDPPRSGLTAKMIEIIVGFNPSRIVYVSCNPATMARDAQFFAEAGYQIKKFSLVDQFPHTAHIESVALLEKGVSNNA